MVLHILLIILKIIGIIIAVLLGLILLLLVILLCVPVRYRMEASMPGEIKESTVRGRVTWLLRLILHGSHISLYQNLLEVNLKRR